MSINPFKAVSLSLVLTVAVALGAPGQSHAQKFKPGDDTIAEIAELTVFAPSDAAFALAGLNATNICSSFETDVLTTILLYHVVGERRPSPSVINGRNKMIPMLAGGAIYPVGNRSLTINANNSTVNIAAPDILASNGIIHVIDFVLLP